MDFTAVLNAAVTESQVITRAIGHDDGGIPQNPALAKHLAAAAQLKAEPRLLRNLVGRPERGAGW